MLVFVNERLEVTRTGFTSPVLLTVIPISYTEYARQMSKPYKRPLHYQAGRLLNTSEVTQDLTTVTTRNADIIAGSQDTFSKYVARYVKRPQAIVLVNLEGDLTVGGVATEQECELDPVLHQDVLQRAVELAKAAYTGDLNSQIVLGTNSETNKGMLTQSK